MTKLTHVIRASSLSKERTYRLGTNALHWQDEKLDGQLAYADIDLVRLINYSSFGSEQGCCKLRDRSGKSIKIPSHSYKSPGAFEDRSETYAPLIRELILRVASKSPPARFIAGSTVMWIVWLALLASSIVIAVLLIMALLGGASISGGVIAPILVFTIFGPSMWRHVRQGKMRNFEPVSPPAEYLGTQVLRA